MAEAVPSPPVHPYLAPSAALALAHLHRPTPLVEVILAQRERFLDAQPPRARASRSSHAAAIRGDRRPCGALPRRSHRRWAGPPGSASPCCAAGGQRGKPSRVAGERRRPAASSTDMVVMGPPRIGQRIRALPYTAGADVATACLGRPASARAQAAASRRPSLVHSGSPAALRSRFRVCLYAVARLRMFGSAPRCPWSSKRGISYSSPGWRTSAASARPLA
jgi:hypothetical protein